MKIIFLDIDGVVNNLKSMRAAGAKGVPLLLDRDCVARLQKLVEDTGAELVLTSVWRLQRLWCGPIVRALVQAGWKGRPPLIDRTPRLAGGLRGDEIAQWLAERPEVKFFVILDDDSDMSSLMHKLVQCDCYTGLSEADAAKAAVLLGAAS